MTYYSRRFDLLIFRDGFGDRTERTGKSRTDVRGKVRKKSPTLGLNPVISKNGDHSYPGNAGKGKE